MGCVLRQWAGAVVTPGGRGCRGGGKPDDDTPRGRVALDVDGLANA